MKFTALKCPNCDAPLDDPGNLNAFYCKYCGYRIVLDDLTDEQTKASVKFGRMRHKERMRDKEYDENYASWEREERTKQIDFVRWFIALACLFALLLGIGAVTFFQSNREEKRLQQTVDAIIADIKNGDFVEARTKANSLHYTTNSDNAEELQKKWDDTRKRLLKDINKAEKEAKKAD